MRISCQSQRDRGQSRVEERWRGGGLPEVINLHQKSNNVKMSFQHLQLSEPVFGLFLSNAQHRAFLQTAERKHEGSEPRCTGTWAGPNAAQCVYTKIQHIWLKMLCCQSPSFLSENDCKAYECLQLVCLLRSIKLLFHSTRFLSFSNILGCVILQRLFFSSKIMTFSMSKDNLCMGPGKRLPRAVSIQLYQNH